MTVTFELGRSSSLALARRAERDKLPIGIVCQLNPDEENPAVTTGLYKYGTVADVLNVSEMPDGTHRAFVRSRGRFRIMGRGEGAEIDALCARVKPVEDIVPENSDEFDTLVDLVRTTSANALKDSDPAGIRMGMAQYPIIPATREGEAGGITGPQFMLRLRLD